MTFQQRLVALHNDRRNAALPDIAATFAVMAGVVYILVRYPGPWSYALAFAGIGLMQYRIVIACHEAVHKTLLFPLWLNETVGSIQCALVGINLLWYRRQHLGHHAAHDIGHDTDAYIYEPILQARPGIRRLGVWIFGTAGEILEKLHQKGFTVTATIEAEGKARAYSLAIVAVQALLLAICTLWLSWWYYFAFWLLPLLTIAIFMNRTRVLLEHGYAHVPHQGDSELRSAPVVAVNLTAGILERFFIAPYGMNHHLVHHRAPSLPSYRSGDLMRLFREQGSVAPSTSTPSYFQALRHVLWS